MVKLLELLFAIFVMSLAARESWHKHPVAEPDSEEMDVG